MFGLGTLRKPITVSYSPRNEKVITVFHGSDGCRENPEMGHNPEELTRDFGDGFYLSDKEQSAKEWALRKTKGKPGKITIFDFRIAEAMKDGVVTRFDYPGPQWAEFVVRNRLRMPTVHKDIVIGPVADNNMYDLLTDYKNGFLTYDEFCDTLAPYRTRYGDIVEQYAFTTQDSLYYLDYIDCIGARK